MAVIEELTDRHVASRGVLIFINVNVARLRSDGHDETRSSSHCGDAWSFPECQISIKRAMQVMRWETNIKALMRAIGTVQLTSTCNRTAEKIHGIIPRSWCDRSAIAVRSSCDRGTFGEIVAHDHATIDGPRSPRDRGHQSHVPTRSNGRKNRAKFPFKKTMYLPYFSTFD